MNDTYWWLKTSGGISQISYEKYKRLCGKNHLLAHTYGESHLTLVKGKNVLYLDINQMSVLLANAVGII